MEGTEERRNRETSKDVTVVIQKKTDFGQGGGGRDPGNRSRIHSLEVKPIYQVLL